MTDKKNPFTELKRLETTYLPMIDDVHCLLERLGIECRLVGRYVKLTCPKCHSKNRISVNYYAKEEKYSWTCWKESCDCKYEFGDNLIGLVKAVRKVDHETALELITAVLEPEPETIPF